MSSQKCSQCVYSAISKDSDSKRIVTRCILSPVNVLPPEMAQNLQGYMSDDFANQCFLYERKKIRASL